MACRRVQFTRSNAIIYSTTFVGCKRICRYRPWPIAVGRMGSPRFPNPPLVWHRSKNSALMVTEQAPDGLRNSSFDCGCVVNWFPMPSFCKPSAKLFEILSCYRPSSEHRPYVSL